MSITVGWHDADKTIIAYTFSRGWTWDDLNRARALEHAMRNTVDHRVDVMLVMCGAPIVPRDPVSRFKSFASTIPDDYVMTVIVCGNAFVRSLVNVFRRMYSAESIQAIHFAESVREAEALIANDRTGSPAGK